MLWPSALRRGHGEGPWGEVGWGGRVGERVVSQEEGHATELVQVKSTDLCVQRYLAL